MSHWENQEQQDDEGADTTVSYTLSFIHGGDTVEVTVSHPWGSDEVEGKLTDPELLKALHFACRGILDDYFKAQDEDEENQRIRLASDAEYPDILSQGF